MLIIAMPKSVSTSLMKTLEAGTGIPAKQTFFPAQQWPQAPRFDSMARFHSDVREITEEQATNFARPKRIFKQHLVPTENNMNLIGEQKFVLLTREPEEIVLAYRRWESTGDSPPRIEFKGLETEEQWLQRAEDIGLLQEFRDFRSRWLTKPGALEVTYRELLDSTDTVFDAIEDHFGFNRTSRPVTLLKERYTRD
jgi:hypothetical protein